MKNNLPSGSNIRFEDLSGHKVIIIPYENSSILKYFIGTFLLFWIGGWFIGLLSALTEIITGDVEPFLVFWLLGWTVGGAFVGYMIFKIFRKSVPEQIFLNYPSLLFDSGIAPLKFTFSFSNQKEYYKSLFQKRKQIEFYEPDLKTIILRETNNGNRLTLDKGNQRIELASGATEIEREWLYDYLKEHYSL